MVKIIEWELWVLGGPNPCRVCDALAGQLFQKGIGPQPVIDTHPNCQCQRVYSHSEITEEPKDR